MLPSILTIVVLGAAPACGPLDVDTAMALAAERSDEVAIKQAEVMSARADEALAASLRILPMASATVITGPAPEAHGNILESSNSNRSLTGLRPFGRIDIQAIQPIYTWGRLDAASDAAAAGVRARQELVVDTLATVQLRVTQLYWGVSLAKRLLGIANDVDKALDEADRRARESLEAADGEVSPADKFRLDVFRSLVRGRAADAQKGLEQAQIGLAATLGITPQRLVLKDAPLDPADQPVPEVAQAVAAAEQQRPDLRALGEAIRAREAEVKAEEGAMLPQFFAAGAFTYAYAPNRDLQLNPWVRDDFNALGVGAVLGFRQDLSFFTLSAKAQKARAEKDVLERQRAGLLRLVQVQVEAAISDVKAAQTRLAAMRQGLRSGRSLFRSVSLDFTAGLIDGKTLIEAYGVYVESQVAAAQSAYDLVVARGRLAQVSGDAPRRGGAGCELQ